VDFHAQQPRPASPNIPACLLHCPLQTLRSRHRNSHSTQIRSGLIPPSKPAFQVKVATKNAKPSKTSISANIATHVRHKSWLSLSAVIETILLTPVIRANQPSTGSGRDIRVKAFKCQGNRHRATRPWCTLVRSRDFSPPHSPVAQLATFLP
jgi:hypothetical protein